MNTNITYNEYADAQKLNRNSIRMYIHRTRLKCGRTGYPDMGLPITQEDMALIQMRGTKRTVKAKKDTFHEMLTGGQGVAPKAERPRPVTHTQNTITKTAGFTSVNLPAHSEIIVYIGSAMTWYGLSVLFGAVGVMLGLLYTIASVWLVELAKDEKQHTTAAQVIWFFWVVELAAIFVHTSVYNNAIWHNAGDMVFRPEPGSVTPYLTALVMGCFTSAFPLFSLHTQIIKSQNAVEYA